MCQHSQDRYRNKDRSIGNSCPNNAENSKHHRPLKHPEFVYHNTGGISCRLRIQYNPQFGYELQLQLVSAWTLESVHYSVHTGQEFSVRRLRERTTDCIPLVISDLLGTLNWANPHLLQHQLFVYKRRRGSAGLAPVDVIWNSFRRV
jgi:hypothetical protein